MILKYLLIVTDIDYTNMQRSLFTKIDNNTLLIDF